MFFKIFQEKSGEENNKGTGDKFESRWYPTGWVLLEEIRSKADQGLAVPTVITIY